MTQIDEFRENLKETIRDFSVIKEKWREMKDEDKKESDELLSSKKLSPEQKAIISLNSQIISGDLVNMRGHMVVLHTLDALAITMKILEISITSLEKRSLPLGVSESKEKSEKIQQLENEVADLIEQMDEAQPLLDTVKEAIDKTQKYFNDHR